MLAPLGNGEAYQNYPDANLKSWRTAYYGSAYSDLVALKRERDPDRLLRFPQAIGSSVRRSSAHTRVRRRAVMPSSARSSAATLAGDARRPAAIQR